MVGIFAAAAGALALLDEAIGAGEAEPPKSEADLFATLERRWTGRPLSALDRSVLEKTAHEAWRRAEAQLSAGGEAIFAPGRGEIVVDPFAVRRAAVDLASAWPEAEESPGRSRVEEVGGGWVVPFADVKRKGGAYALFRDTSDALAMVSIGTLIGDRTAGTRVASSAWIPYWRVVGQHEDWTEVVPIGKNPLSTGVGAGGASIGAFDLQVATGEYGRAKVARAIEKLRTHTAQIEDVTCLLAGHVPMQMGPNGAQGGWYNVDDRSSRGGMEGRSPEDQVAIDAARLSGWGFAVPRGALRWPLAISTEAWNRWVAGPPEPSTAEAPPQWLAVLRKRTERARYRYDAESLAQLATRIDPDALRTRLDRDLRLLLENPERYRELRPYGPHTAVEIVQWGIAKLDRQAKEAADAAALDIPGEDFRSPESLIRQLRHPERRVSVRAARIAIQHAAVEALRPGPRRWPEVFHRWVKEGRGDYLAFEAVLDHFALEDDREGLRLGLSLPDPDNRRRAAGSLVRLDKAPVLSHLRGETDPTVLRTIVNALAELDGPAGAIDALDEAGVLDRLPRKTGEVVWDVHVADLASTLRYLVLQASLRSSPPARTTDLLERIRKMEPSS